MRLMTQATSLLICCSFLTLGCGKLKELQEEESRGDNPNAIPISFGDVKSEVQSYSGTLHLIPNAVGLEGLINYTLYESGLIVYRGYVSYRPQPYFSEIMTKTFHGEYKALPKSLLSSTYAHLGDRHSDFKLSMEVGEFNEQLNVVNVQVNDDSATGKFEIDTKEKFIDIHYAEVKGRVLGMDVTIAAKK